ncbi:ATP-grasp domain-containing protein [Pelagibius marinus]|uniref:ATP-grasp domain-containing protein n=1 Tax=Pelagibius marinus TaxID=2762760 RepID=UPI0018725541|nr:hypothetical protein [Pelagibius marinus]
MRLAILSTTKLPKFLGDGHPDEASLFAEDDVLIGALAARDVAAERVPWRRADDWSAFDLVLVRSTWDYIDDLSGYLKVLEAIAGSGCRLVNSLETIRWNFDKRYLIELQAAGLPVVPTVLLPPGADVFSCAAHLGDAPLGYVLKPTVGVGGFGTRRCADAQAVAAALAEEAASPQILQPFLEAIATEGEWSFVFGGGRFLYAAQKTPRAGDYRVQVMYGAVTRGRAPAPEDLAAAEACYQALPVAAELARIDMVRRPDGGLALMEAELIEPQLYFFDVPEAAGLVAEAVLSLS